VHTGNVDQLGLAWYLDLDTRRGQEATPLVIDGVMYTTTAWSKVVAADAATGEQLWIYDPKVPGEAGFKACCDVVSRGAAFADGKVFSATLDGRLIALDAQTGELLWSTLTVDPSKPYTITGAPRVAKGKVYIGNGGAEYGVRGYVSAYDANDGRLVWRFYTVPGDPEKSDGAASDAVLREKAEPTWSGTSYWQFGGGGTVWDAIVYDPELDQLYIGTGNGSPWNRQIRSEGKGDNLFLSSIPVALPGNAGGDLGFHRCTTYCSCHPFRGWGRADGHSARAKEWLLLRD
jgi:PQQ-dependent dehydrogenase (methanol/ethanol family)